MSVLDHLLTMWAKSSQILPLPLTEPENISLKAPSTLFSRGRLSAWDVWLKVVKDLKVGHGSNRNKNVRTKRKRGLNACGVYHIYRWMMAIIQTIVLFPGTLDTD